MISLKFPTSNVASSILPIIVTSPVLCNSRYLVDDGDTSMWRPQVTLMKAKGLRSNEENNNEQIKSFSESTHVAHDTGDQELRKGTIEEITNKD